MKKHFARGLAVLTVLVMALGVFAGCGQTYDKDTTAAVFEKTPISADEAKLYVYATQSDIEENNLFLIMYSFNGSFEDFWAYAPDGAVPYSELGKDSAIMRMLETKTLNAYAKDNNITLTAEDEEKLEAAFDSFKEKHERAIAKAGSSDEMIKTYLRENAIANRSYLEIISTVDKTFTDEENEQNRRKLGEAISVYARPSYQESDEEDAETIEVSEEDQAKRREEVVNEVMTRLKAGEEPSDIVAFYQENAKDVNVSYLGEQTASSSDAIEEGEEYDFYAQFLWEMKTDEYRIDEITSTSGLITAYALHCINDDDAEARKTAEENMIAQREDTLFRETYAELVKKHKKYHIYDTVVDNIRIQEPLHDSIDMGGSTEEETSEEEAEEAEEE